MSKRKIVFGIALISFGFLLLARSTGIFYIDFGDMIRLSLPFIFIGSGIWLIIRKKKLDIKIENDEIHINRAYSSSGQTQNKTEYTNYSKSDTQDFAKEQSQQAGSTYSANFSSKATESPHSSKGNKTKYSKSIGDMFIDCKGQCLENIDISIGIGDLELKLHEGKLSPGLNRILISGLIGDVRIFVPKNIPHYCHCSNFIGDIEMGGKRASGFSNNVEVYSDNYADAESKIFISANGFIGDIRVYVI